MSKQITYILNGVELTGSEKDYDDLCKLFPGKVKRAGDKPARKSTRAIQRVISDKVIVPRKPIEIEPLSADTKLTIAMFKLMLSILNKKDAKYPRQFVMDNITYSLSYQCKFIPSKEGYDAKGFLKEDMELIIVFLIEWYKEYDIIPFITFDYNKYLSKIIKATKL